VRRLALPLALLAALLAAAPASAQDDLRASVVRTAHGIPHITASSWAGLGYGYGYAFAEDNLCVMADQYVTVRGERSKFFGPDGTWTLRGNGTTNTNLESDFFFKRIIKRQTIEKLMAQAPPLGPRPEIREGVRGYVAGYNRYIEDVGIANLPDAACRGKEWVRPIDEIDAYRRFYQLALLASSGVAINGIGGAQPPLPGASSAVPAPSEVTEALSGRLPEPLGGIGSNAFGIGRDQTDNGKGMLLGNPHFPWDGTERFYQAHLTIPGKVDVSGASLFGVPIVLIGHTRGLAWSHTVSTAYRFTPYELKLVPGSPTTYLVDGQPKQMERDELTVEVRRPDGSIEPQTRTLYTTQWGPVFDELLGLPIFPWTPATAWAMGDANASNFRYLNHFLETNLAQSVPEYDAVLKRNQGIPWVNSIAADDRGNAYYADISVVPHVTDQQAQDCNSVLGTATFQLLRLPVLDGSRSACAWGTDPSAVTPGILGPEENLPSMTRSDYAGNSNDSFWLSNLKQPLEGFPQIVGDERTARSLRTRSGLLMVDGTKFTLQGLQDMVFSNRQYAGELWRDDTVAMCRSMPDLAEACDVLERWNLRDDNDSKGALLWRRYAQRLLPSGPASAPAPYAVPFDPEDPANTPRGLNTSDPRVPQALRDAVSELRGLEIPLDAPLGAVQAETRNGERIPIHGGPGTAGVFNAINVSTGDLEAKSGYGTIPHGSSFVQAVQFVDGACPVMPRTILTYSQSTNEASPWFSDQTRMYSRKEWNAVPFCAPDVRRAAISRTALDASQPTVTTSGCAATAAPVTRGRAKVAGRRRLAVSVPAGARAQVRRGARRIARLRGPARRTVRAGRNGVYLVRFTENGASRRVAFLRRRGRLRALPPFERRQPCGLITAAALGSPTAGRAVRLTVRLAEPARLAIAVRRGRRVVSRLRSSVAGNVYRTRIPARRLKRRGTYRMRITATAAGNRRSVTTVSAVRR
jgi:acyl-homoserine-lactone acylase